MRVLIVEDNEMNRDMLGRRLQRSGHEVVFAEDGLAGVVLRDRGDAHRDEPELHEECADPEATDELDTILERRTDTHLGLACMHGE